MQSLEFKDKAKLVKCVIFDVDGVFTDGRIYVDDQGLETKAFYVLDGQGIKFLQKMNIEIAVISGRNTKGVAYRMQYLGIQHVFQGHTHKIPVYEKLLKDFQLEDRDVAYMGDDLHDLPLLKRVGLAVTVPNAVIEVREAIPFVTEAQGGKGAIREVSELILKAQGKWEEVLSQYL